MGVLPAFLFTVFFLKGAVPASTGPAEGVRFTEITAAGGLRFTHNGGRTGRKLLPETMGQESPCSMPTATAGSTCCSSMAAIGNRVVPEWPSGLKQSLGPAAVNQVLTIREGEGIVATAEPGK